MPKMTVDGMAEFGELITALESKSKDMLKKGLYEANSIIYKEVENKINALPEGRHSVDKIQKQGLIKGLGGSGFQEENGELFFLISESGYNNKYTEKYPNGQPNIMILRSIEAGGFAENGYEVMQKQPIMRKSLNHSKKQAIAKVQEVLSEEVKKLQK